MTEALDILIVGAGQIARHYLKVIESLGHRAIVIGQGKNNIELIQKDFSKAKAFAGGIENWIKENEVPSYAIIATPIDHLTEATKALLNAGCKDLLVEKPLTYSIEEANEITVLANSLTAQVNIAFNRRSYVSVSEAARLIAQDGGVSSFHFDFTEAVFRINPKKYSKETNKYWGIANSSHVIDTAFYLGGKPKWIESRQSGTAVPWHPSGSIFTGIGETEQKIPFTYHANWGCPGKWNIEIMTPKRKLFFSPMEQLYQQHEGIFKVELVELDYSVDLDYKPGFYKQVSSWLEGKKSLMNSVELGEELLLLQKIMGY